MSLVNNLKPRFWDHKERVPGKSGEQYVFRHKWKVLVGVITPLILVPLFLAIAFFYNSSHNRALVEIKGETAVLAKNAAVDIELFLKEYQSSLRFMALMFGVEQLHDPEVMQKLHSKMEKSGGGFIALDLFDMKGHLVSYVGYSKSSSPQESEWVEGAEGKNVIIGTTSYGSAKVPHLFIAIKLYQQNGVPFIFRGIFSNFIINDLLSRIRLDVIQDVFLATESGMLISSSKYCGGPGDTVCLPTGKDLPRAVLEEDFSSFNGIRMPVFIGAAKIDHTKIILGLILLEDEVRQLMAPIRNLIYTVLAPAVFVVICIVICLVTYVVHGLYGADLRRHEYLQQVERNDKLASVGRLAAGVAHEVNNPLAIINEKAGLIKDMFTYTDDYKADERLVSTVDSIIKAVERAGSITHRLLGFARKIEVSVEKINIEHLIRETFGFLKKEAEYKNIQIKVKVAKNVPEIITDRGKLQQILLNIINNAFAAMDEGGEIDVTVRRLSGQRAVSIKVRDVGCGISEENMKLIFEPFFSTKTQSGGTGLGLAITYGLIRDLHGTLEVESKVGIGTTFSITLPFRMETY